MFDKFLPFVFAAVLVAAFAPSALSASPDEQRKQATTLDKDGNYLEAAEIFKTLALDPAATDKDAVADARQSVACFLRVGEQEKARALTAELLAARPDSWRVVAFSAAAAQSGRGRHYRDNYERDRVLGIQAYLKAEALLDSSADPASPREKTDFYSDFANLLVENRQDAHAWRLTALTDLETLPGDEDSRPYYAIPRRHAPVDADGAPVYHAMPESWDAAASDGERWRWLLGKMAASSPEGRGQADLAFGRFLFGQFGVHTMTMDAPLSREADIGGETGPFAVRTLTEKETIARLATGMKRFSPPEEHNHIAVLRRAAASDDPKTQSAALGLLAEVFENRQQYNKAVAFRQRCVDLAKRLGRNPEADEARLQAIVGKNGMLEIGPVAPAGSRTTLSYLYRNGDAVALTAKRLDERALLSDIRKLLKSDSDQFFEKYAYASPSSIGRLVVEDDESRYIAETVAEWEVALDPLPDHYSRRASIELPFDKAGCYLIEARMRGGNVSRVVAWINDLALVRRNAGGGQMLFVADAVTGNLIPSASISFLGYERNYDDKRARHSVETTEFAERVNADGILLLPVARLGEGKQWLITAETEDGRMAYIGFDGIWAMTQNNDPEPEERCFVITDRPAYRPGQDIGFKIWYGQTSYGGRPARVDGRAVNVTIRNPRGEIVYEKVLSTDSFGGAADSITLGPDAPLGHYYIGSEFGGGAGFRLEEYKKPEFEVALDTPDSAIVLGDTAQLKIRATYYHGAPVANANVSYKIVRTTHNSSWTPPWRWDWLYGEGAWQNGQNFAWYPGGARWNQPFIRPIWHFEQPEVVAEGEGELDADGILRVSLDTNPAKELFGDRDHAYAVTAEVTDRSRRTIVGTGNVVAARKPFTVSMWTDRGYYPAGQRIGASIRVMQPMGGGVAASGKAVLHRIRYRADGTPEETEIAAKSVQTDADGNGETAFVVADAGQYRLACVVTDATGNSAETATLITVRGQSGEGDFRFGALELIAERREYQPGDTLKLAVNSENGNATVLLFPRAERTPREGEAAPLLLALDNGSRIVDIPIGRADQPNFFCEAVTVFKGRVYVETREIFVPPADKALRVEIQSDRESYFPGSKANFTVKLSDADGEPVAGQCVVSVYDRSVEYISGGSNVADIRSFFWSWKRYYNSAVSSSLDKSPYSPQKQGDVFWHPIGAFGSQEADWNDDAVHVNGRLARSGRAQYGGPGMARATIEAPMMAVQEDMAALPAAAPKLMAGGGGDGMAETTVRSDFADTALWLTALETNSEGVASFSLTMPENLTAWKARVWAMGDGVRVGENDAGVETKKNVIVRAQAPRFLTQKDQVILSANLHNYLPRAKTARAELVLEGGLLEPASGQNLVREVALAANGEARVDWLVDARRPGTARVVMKLLTDEESDATEIVIPVAVHGARRVESFGGVLRNGENEEIVRFRVPNDRLAEQSRLEFSFSPSIASAMLDALPYLVDYPYGCTEQTLNRFLPLVMSRSYLRGMGLNLADAMRAVDAARDDSQSAAWRATWGDPRGKTTPVFDDAQLDAMIASGIERLAAMQYSDGGWGWFSGPGGNSWPHTTAVVVHGLLAARENGAAIPRDMLDQGIDWLRAYQQEQISRLKLDPAASDASMTGKERADELDAFIYLILAEDGRRTLDPDMRDFLYRDRLRLSAMGLSMFGVALHIENATNALDMVVRNLSQYLKRDDALGTAWLTVPAQGWWRWHADAVETQAWYLKLLARVDPKSDTASGVAKHLLRNRKNGSYWRSTRDTAYAVEALADYAVASGEAAPDMTVTLYLDGKQVMERRLTAAAMLADNRFVLEGVAVEAGDHELRLVRSGGGNVYFGGGVDVFSLEDPIRAAGLELTVNRVFHKLVRDDADVAAPNASGRAVASRRERYRRETLSGIDSGNIATVAGGDLVEVELTIEARNDYEYIVFEDMKAAGLEAVELRSGYSADLLGAYVEYRDQKVTLFLQHLPQGRHTLRYRFRAESPGSFSALPVFGGGMYATELFANSDEMKLRIAEEGVYGE